MLKIKGGMTMISSTLGFKNSPEVSQKTGHLYKIDPYGKIYIPSFIRRLFRGYRFFILIEDGKIVLDPVKVEDGVFEGVDKNEID